MKLQCLTEEREMTFGLSYWEVFKNEGLKNWYSTVCVCLNFTLLHSFKSCYCTMEANQQGRGMGHGGACNLI